MHTNRSPLTFKDIFQKQSYTELAVSQDYEDQHTPPATHTHTHTLTRLSELPWVKSGYNRPLSSRQIHYLKQWMRRRVRDGGDSVVTQVKYALKEFERECL